MRENIRREDLDLLIAYLKADNPRLTQGEMVKTFEEEWSKWLGVKYSVYVNSGSSANLITLAALRQTSELGEVIVPTLTWISDIAAVLQNGFTPVFVDINPHTLSLDTKQIISKLNENTRAVFLTHAQGFNGVTEDLLTELDRQKIPLIEDVCEAHGAEFNGRLLGSIGLMSNFSFYYAHHMSTIEGGMVCTNDDHLYQLLRMFRSHGLVRESSSESLKKTYLNSNPSLNADFIFAFPGYNVRNNELSAVIGRNQLKLLEENNKKRNSNHRYFLKHLDAHRFRTTFQLEGSSNYAFNLILNAPVLDLRDRIELAMDKSGIEFRRGSSGGGNQLRQPYLKQFLKHNSLSDFPETEHIHFFGWYLGNFPDLQNKTILEICEIVNTA